MRRLSSALFLAAFLALLPGQLQGQAEEATLKAVFLERFARFVEWPDSAELADTSSPFVISVLGDDAFADVVRTIYRTRKIRGKAVEVRSLSRASEVGSPHLLFVGRSQAARLGEILDAVRGRPILTVSDSDGFAVRGVQINFFLRGGRIGFEVNEGVLRASSLDVSYLLLRAAELVGNQP